MSIGNNTASSAPNTSLHGETPSLDADHPTKTAVVSVEVAGDTDIRGEA
jgi:hypothetical protein